MRRTSFSIASLLSLLSLVGTGCSSSSSEEPAANATVPPFAEAPGAAANPSVMDTSGTGNETPADPAVAQPDPSPASGEGTPAVSGLEPGTSAGAAAGETPGAAEMPPAEMPPAIEPPPAQPDPAQPAPMTPASPAFPPSAGCGKANPPQGAGALTIRGAQAQYVVTLPANYDPNTPVPLIFGFHGRGRTHVQFQTIDASNIQTELGSRAVMVYPKSQGGDGWNFAAEVPPSVEFFEALYPQTLNNYCIDTSRIFLVGHSSGAYFTEILACRFGERFRGIGAVAGNLQEMNCSDARFAALLVHGTTDTVVSFAGGMQARDYYENRNGCDNSSVPGAVSPCIAYQNCDAGLPVQWCQHTEPTYTDANTGRPTNHGWPSFASRAISQFFFSLPPR
jgi:poly(3-hydroxybutyrate) depolymerase